MGRSGSLNRWCGNTMDRRGLEASSVELMGSCHMPGQHHCGGGCHRLKLLPVLVSLCGSTCATGLYWGSEHGPRQWKFVICTLVCKFLWSKAVWGSGRVGKLWVAGGEIWGVNRRDKVRAGHPQPMAQLLCWKEQQRRSYSLFLLVFHPDLVTFNN